MLNTTAWAPTGGRARVGACPPPEKYLCEGLFFLLVRGLFSMGSFFSMGACFLFKGGFHHVGAFFGLAISAMAEHVTLYRYISVLTNLQNVMQNVGKIILNFVFLV